jgi:hypothetical protein
MVDPRSAANRDARLHRRRLQTLLAQRLARARRGPNAAVAAKDWSSSAATSAKHFPEHPRGAVALLGAYRSAVASATEGGLA